MQGMKNNWDTIDLAMFALLIVLFLYGVSQLAKATPNRPDPRPMGPGYNYWTPTAEDQKYIDSLYDIVKETESNVDTISNTLDRCLNKLDNIADE